MSDKPLGNLSIDGLIALRNNIETEISQRVEEAGLPPSKAIETNGGAQSRVFMIDMLPDIWKFVLTHKWGSELDVLDVGPGAAYGSELLASIHASEFLGYRLNVDTLDLDPRYATLIKSSHKYLRHSYFCDIRDFDRKYDIVICSHVIEHVEDPLEFISQLRKLCKGVCFILAPYDENPKLLSQGHVNIFGSEFLSNFKSDEFCLKESLAWGAFLKPRYKMLFLKLKGGARGLFR